MFATIRRYEGVDVTRIDEVTTKANETLVPQLRRLPGFAGYTLVDAGNGIVSSLGMFETPEQADESNRIVTAWIAEEKLDGALPNRPKITSGKVVSHSEGLVPVA